MGFLIRGDAMKLEKNALFTVVALENEDAEFNKLNFRLDQKDRYRIIRAFTQENFLSFDYLRSEYVEQGLGNREVPLSFYGQDEFQNYMYEVCQKVNLDRFYWIENTQYNRLVENIFEGNHYYLNLQERSHRVDFTDRKKEGALGIFSKLFSGDAE
jgi:hypothetical protein